MSPEEVRRRINEILHRVAPEADLDSLGPDENIREALDIDSFDFLQVIVAVAEAFGVDIPEADYRKVTTLQGFTDYLVRRTQKI